MSLVMNDYWDYLERGYRHSDKIICHDCITDYALKAVVKQNGTMQVCSYCGRRKKSIPLEDLMPAIMSGIHFLYDKAVDHLPVDQGEYVGRTFSSEDLILNQLCSEIGADENVLADITSIMNDDVWCMADPYDDPVEAVEYDMWNQFCKLVKTKVRYVFFKTRNSNLDNSNPSDILNRIASHIVDLKLVRKIGKNDKLFRCRTHETEKWLRAKTEFVPPTIDKTGAGRMNPEGINIFYLTLDPETALAETDVSGRDYASVASFRLGESINVIDLSKIDDLKQPSIFDEERRDQRHAISFLKKFNESISSSVEIKGIDYVPTQIVTEYFRHVFVKKDEPIEGILYNSAKNKGGKCLALFMDREDALKGKHGIHMANTKTMHYKKQFQAVTVPRSTTEIVDEMVETLPSLPDGVYSDYVEQGKNMVDSILKDGAMSM